MLKYIQGRIGVNKQYGQCQVHGIGFGHGYKGPYGHDTSEGTW